MSYEKYPVYLAEPGRDPTLPPETGKFVHLESPQPDDARYGYIYCLMGGERVLYVGQTMNLFARLGQHAREKVFDRVYWFKCRSQDADFMETALIKYYKPEYNERSVSGGLSQNEVDFLEDNLGLTVHKPGRTPESAQLVAREVRRDGE